MKTILKLVGVLVVLALLGVLYIYSGLYDVAASSPDTGFVHWVLNTTRSRSVHRAYEALEGKVQIPKLADPQLIQTGLVHYHEMCVTCHGAPGVKVSEIGDGLNPAPPELAFADAEEPLETFWIVKHGIKMTGMPGFGKTHSDEEVWAIVAFVQRMPDLSSEEYQAMVRQAGLGRPAGQAQPSGGHHHEPGTPPHED
jgi:mono/diheme cytochrome c family protein